MPKTRYTQEWREEVRSGAQRSAEAMVPPLYNRYKPETVVDVGAGEGWFAQKFQELGADTWTIDGPWTEADFTLDFEKPATYPDYPEKPYDLALCLETAEHLSAGVAEPFVKWLSSLATVIVFSAALPGQGGNGHINEQPPEYWADLFKQNGKRGSGALRWVFWHDSRIEGWYRNNLLVFGDDNLPEDGCPHVIHPYLWKLYGHG